MDNLKNSKTGELSDENQEFLAIVSHEVRKPITEIKNLLALILEGETGTISQDTRECVAQAYVVNEYLIRLVERMTKVAKIRSGRITLNLSRVNLTQAIQVVVNDFKIPTFERGQKLQFIPQEEELYVQADLDSVVEILNNLISNASKYTPKGGHITITSKKAGEEIITSVEDNGNGISPENQEKVFDIFSKASVSPELKEKGTGVGLYLSRRLAEMQGGRLWLEKSTPDKGSTFSLALEVEN